MDKKIEIRCKNGHCNRLFMNYYVTGNNVDLNLEGFELKCEKCKRVLRLKNYTEVKISISKEKSFISL